MQVYNLPNLVSASTDVSVNHAELCMIGDLYIYIYINLIMDALNNLGGKNCESFFMFFFSHACYFSAKNFIICKFFMVDKKKHVRFLMCKNLLDVIHSLHHCSSRFSKKNKNSLLH